jgi:predicted enzyme related to lactoylglutathione lyase
VATTPQKEETSMGYANGLFGWADLAVPDTQQGAAFYSGLFGWDAVEPPAGDSMPYTMFMLDGQPVAGMGPLRPEDIEAGQPPVWSSYIIVNDVDAIAAKAKELGATLLMEPMEIPGSGKMVIAIDPVGAAISFWQAGGHEGAGLFNVPGAMSWNELACRDVEAAGAFYTELLGWGSEVQQIGNSSYLVVTVGDRPNGRIYDMTGMRPDEIPPHWFVWFTVEDADASAERARSLGGTVLQEPFDSPFGRMVAISDPQGPAFGIVEHPSSK